ncbi:MAG: 3-hydroxybutyrate oligomer hydrolase family protein [Betaproteobacteria bacterium]
MSFKRTILLLALLAPTVAIAGTRCDQILKKLGDELADVNCFESADLTTNNPLTTPLDNSLPGLPAGAFTPRTDRAVLVNLTAVPPVTTPITKAVPGVQISARIASDPAGQARFLLRLPDNWNGRLVVAGTPSQRSEFSSDMAWSDYVVQQGYAFASQNKGMLNLFVTTPADPLGCRLNPGAFSGVFVHFYANDPDKPFTRWTGFMVQAAELARQGVKSAYGNWPRYTYAVGTSNGGYQVRRALEVAPKLFDGGVDWEGTYVAEAAPNLLTDLPPAVLNFPDYVASGYNAAGTAAKNIVAAGYPPDIVSAPDSLWTRNYNSYWEVTACQWQKRLDPTYNTYGSGLSTYNYVQRLSFSDVGDNMAAFATTGRIQNPLVSVQGTMDALLPIDHHGRAYARAVEAGFAERKGGDPHRPGYRLYEIQNGNHIENYKNAFPQLEYILFHAQHAFELIVGNVESGAALPPGQCVPRGGSIAGSPAQPGHCANLFVP